MGQPLRRMIAYRFTSPVEAARALFAERDYEQVATEEILGRAGVSRGAMYHHFASKRDLFVAAFRASEADVMQRVAERAAPADGAFAALRIGCLAYLDECASNRELQGLGLRQGRSVLGWEGWRKAAADLGIGAMRGAVQAAMEAGELRGGDVDATAALVLGALIEAGLLVATDPDPAVARARVEPVVLQLLDGLRA